MTGEEQITALIAKPVADPDQIAPYVRARESLDKGRRELLAAIPACPYHGDRCHAHVREWIKAAREAVAIAREVAARQEVDVRVDDDYGRSWYFYCLIGRARSRVRWRMWHGHGSGHRNRPGRYNR